MLGHRKRNTLNESFPTKRARTGPEFLDGTSRPSAGNWFCVSPRVAYLHVVCSHRRRPAHGASLTMNSDDEDLSVSRHEEGFRSFFNSIGESIRVLSAAVSGAFSNIYGTRAVSHEEELRGARLDVDRAELQSENHRLPKEPTSAEREDAVSHLYDDDVRTLPLTCAVERSDLRTLQEQVWLNDEVINAYFRLLQQRATRRAGGPQCHFFNSFFWTKLRDASSGTEEYTYSNVARWTKKIDLFGFDLVFIPLHVDHNHWTLGCVDMRSRLVFYFDSLENPPHPDYFPTIVMYLMDEHQNKQGTALPDPGGWSYAGNNFVLSTQMPAETLELLEVGDLADKGVHVPIPHQTNSSDCGVFMCMYAEHLSVLRFPFKTFPDNSEEMRIKMACDLLRGSV